MNKYNNYYKNATNQGFCVGKASLIKNHTHKGPKAVSSKKKIPTSGELMNCGAILINTKDTPTVIIINDKSIKSVELIIKLLTKILLRKLLKVFLIYMRVQN